MRTLLTEVAAIESALLGSAAPEDALLLQAKALIDPELAANISAQQQSYQLIKQHGRQQLKAELETIHQKLFTESPYDAFARKIKALFRRV